MNDPLNKNSKIQIPGRRFAVITAFACGVLIGVTIVTTFGGSTTRGPDGVVNHNRQSGVSRESIDALSVVEKDVQQRFRDGELTKEQMHEWASEACCWGVRLLCESIDSSFDSPSDAKCQLSLIEDAVILSRTPPDPSRWHREALLEYYLKVASKERDGNQPPYVLWPEGEVLTSDPFSELSLAENIADRQLFATIYLLRAFEEDLHGHETNASSALIVSECRAVREYAQALIQKRNTELSERMRMNVSLPGSLQSQESKNVAWPVQRPRNMDSIF